jgi:hypothetical protein
LGLVLEADRVWVREPPRHGIERTWLDILCIAIHWIELIAEDARKVMVRTLRREVQRRTAGLLLQ